MNRVYLCNYKVYLNNFGVIVKGKLVRFVQMCKYQYICYWVAHSICEKFNFCLKQLHLVAEFVLFDLVCNMTMLPRD